VFAVEFAGFLAVGNDGAVAGFREEGRDAGAAGAQLFGQRALRREFELEFAGQELAREFLVFADVGGDHLLDLARFQQLAEAEAVDARVVRDGGQLLDAGVAQRFDQRLRECRTGRSRRRRWSGRLDDTGQRRCRVRIHFVHTRPFCNLSCKKPFMYRRVEIPA
jgi:hypothetical protein